MTVKLCHPALKIIATGHFCLPRPVQLDFQRDSHLLDSHVFRLVGHQVQVQRHRLCLDVKGEKLGGEFGDRDAIVRFLFDSLCPFTFTHQNSKLRSGGLERPVIFLANIVGLLLSKLLLNVALTSQQ